MAKNTREEPAQLAKPIISTTATIRGGESVSNSVDLTTGNLLMILSPPEWTSANISFLVSNDNVTFCDLYDGDGEVIKSMGPERAYLMDPSMTSAALYFKIRSGPLSNPIVQEEDRVFTLSVG